LGNKDVLRRFLYWHNEVLGMQPDNFIEVSFEVANKVGGIHQVLKSKSGKMQEYYGDGYLTIGFYDDESAREEFAPRENSEFEDVFDRLETEEGIKCHSGVWTIPSAPRCILIDVSEMEKDIDDIKTELWNKYNVDSMEAGHDFDEPVKWSYAVGRLIEEIEGQLEGETVVQAHEWLSGPALFQTDLPSVFTTHATVLGRALSNADFDLQGAVKSDSIEQSLASEYGVKSKHQIEKAAAEDSEVFTTVSKTTGKEATAVLGVEPDVILSNGFNVDDFPSLEELSYEHTKKKEHVKEFLRAYFKPYYDVDLEGDPRILYTSGRYEFHNKGLDVFIDALSRVNQQEGDDFYVFILVPSDVEQQKMEVLENMSLYQELEDSVKDLMPKIRSELLDDLTSGGEVIEGLESVIEERSSRLDSLERNFRAKQDKTPPLCAFDLNYPEDEILSALWENGLRNREEDRVKVVFYPTYLSVGDRLLSMDYNDFIVASSAGIFPSYYEPWGYTPVETAANGALSITTDMAGFGKFLQEKTEKGERKGIKVLERESQSDEAAAEDLAEMVEDFVSYPKTEITERKHNARKLAQLTSWGKLGQNYAEAHEKALEER
jgi:glycogen(starch) synthase